MLVIVVVVRAGLRSDVTCIGLGVWNLSMVPCGSRPRFKRNSREPSMRLQDFFLGIRINLFQRDHLADALEKLRVALVFGQRVGEFFGLGADHGDEAELGGFSHVGAGGRVARAPAKLVVA